MKIELLNLKRQYETLGTQIEERIAEILRSGSYINGPYVKKFEERVAQYVDAKHAIGVANGTDALVIALRALGVGQGDEVITTAFTFYATAEAICAVGATPIFIDVKRSDFNIDPEQIEAHISEKTKAIMPVHIFGSTADMETICTIAKKHNLFVIEDSAQAIGSTYRSTPVGSLADVSTFSFFPTKNLGTYGDGGMITTNNDQIATICRALKSHGSGVYGEQAYELLEQGKVQEVKDTHVEQTVYDQKKYYNYLVGYNSRLDELHAGILDIKLDYLETWNAKRRERAAKYDAAFAETQFTTMELDEANINTYHMYILQSEKRAEVLAFLKEKGISTAIYYPVPMHLQKVFRSYGYEQGSIPVAEYLSNRTFAIPIDPELTDEEVEYIISAVREADQLHM